MDFILSVPDESEADIIHCFGESVLTRLGYEVTHDGLVSYLGQVIRDTCVSIHQQEAAGVGPVLATADDPLAQVLTKTFAIPEPVSETVVAEPPAIDPAPAEAATA